MKVRATSLGFYGLVRRRVGDVFEVESEKNFSAHWMQRIEEEIPQPKKSKKQESQSKQKDADVI